MAWLLAALVAAVFGAAFFALGPLIRRLVLREAVRGYQEPVPEVWITGVVEKVAAVRALSEAQRDRLLRAARDLITNCKWEGAGGLDLTQDMQLIIAAQACLLTLEMPGDPYPILRTVLVYPTAFFAARSPDLRKWSGTSVPEPPLHELGEAWSNGTVVIAWEAA
ncbi:MAG: zinc-dependent peptidase, partial [Gemmatimonadales bacterium]